MATTKKKKSEPKSVSANLSKEALLNEAPRLAPVLRALRLTHPDLESDTLWNNILQRWSEKALENALLMFEKTNELAGFEQLIKPLLQADK